VKLRYWFILLLILIFGGYLRLVDLDKIPPHLGNDEISIAYDSYSIRSLGKDEHGNEWPLSFQSHGDYKAPLYVYMNTVFNYIFGNTEHGVRFLSVLSSLVSIIFMFLIGSEIGGRKLGLLAAILLCLNPKNIIVSRVSFEANLAAAMVLIGFWSMIKMYKLQKIKYAILAGVFLGLSIWGYHTERGFVPIFALVLPLLVRGKINIKRWVWMWIFLIIVAVPIGIDFIKVFQGENNNRASTQLWFRGPGSESFYNDPDVSSANKIVVWISGPVHNYLEHFNFKSNFVNNQELFNKREPLDIGWFLLATLPLLLVGLLNIKIIFPNWWRWVLAFWLISPIVPALTFGGIASVRNLLFVYPTILIMAGGFLYIMGKNKLIGIALSFLIIINFLVFSRAYYVFFPKYIGTNFQYGYKQAWEFIKPNIDSYDRVVVEDKFGEFGQFTGVPHLYFGYFGAFGVEEMQNRYFERGMFVGKYEFRNVDWNQEKFTPNTVYVVSAINPITQGLSDLYKEVDRIHNTDNTLQFYIYATVDE